MNENPLTEARAVADIVKEAVNRPTEIPGKPGLMATVYNREEVLQIGSYERYGLHPMRERGVVHVHDVKSFVHATAIAHVDRSVAGEVAVYANIDRRIITAILNDDGWRDNRIVYAPEYSRVFAAWHSQHGKYMPQRDFAEFLEDRAFDLVEPEPADLISVARMFKATRKVQFESGTKLQSGDVRFVYTEETGATAGSKGQIDIPETFVIGVPIFKGTGKINITATLRYDIDRDRGLLLSYRLLHLEDLIEDSLQQQIVGPLREGLTAEIGKDVLLFAQSPDPVAAFD